MDGLQTIPRSAIAIESPSDRLLVLSEVLERFPVSKSTWFNGVRNGRYPQPVRLGVRRVAWRQSAIDALIAGLE